MERATGKAERLLQMESLLLAHPEGLSQAEMARRLGVHRSTVLRSLPDLTSRFAVHETDDGRLAIDRDHYLMNVRLTLHESMALHLAARLMATRTDKQNPHAAAALRKLGLALEKLAPRVSEHLKASAQVMEDQAQRHDPGFLEVLETLTRAWSDGRVARIWHRLADGRVFEYEFAPYFIEPYAVGQTTHAIGWCQTLKAMRTFKLERIQRIELTDETYTIPEDFEPREMLADAWGIWYTDAEPVEVVLKFHPRVAGRVQETQWHTSEEVEEQADGSLLWRARVAEPREMVNWIRGWGADVEVVEPEGVREALVGEVRKLAAIYDIQPMPAYQLLWAKTSKDRARTHALICHLIDVAEVTRTLWNRVLTEGARRHFAGSLGLDTDAAGRLVSFWAGLHDLGKASPCFQRKYKPAVATLADAGLSFPRRFARDSCYHGTISAEALPGLLELESGLELRLAKKVARAVGGHHGAWPHPSNIDNLSSTELGGEDWGAVRCELFRALAGLYSPAPVGQLGPSREGANAFLTLLSGLTSTADWIGSMEAYFGTVEGPLDLERYRENAGARALRALEALGWIGWQPPEHALSFRDLFGFKPRPMQNAVVNLAGSLSEPALVIVEAPTGSGKTEAALYLADHWARACQQRGLYVAMPTMATSNQMFGRVKQVLGHRYPDSLVNLHLIHSQARWRDEMESMRLETADERPEGTVAAMAWFFPRKRSLLAPFGVGTVDQALLSVLQARHFFVRLFGLSHKTIIFDEVHAYDTYMTTIFQRLLGWLRAVGASVVILSATLPARTRRALLEAYMGRQGTALPEVSYPAISWATEQEADVIPLQTPQSRIIALAWVDHEPGSIVARLAEDLREGGNAAVICNTVGRAQEAYRALREAQIVPDEDLILFHARFPPAWRNEIEKQVLSRFGKAGERPERAVVVATQVIEQSLDLDFDVMVTDLAPVDLVVQRAGRLHRHQRTGRPGPVSSPRLIVAAPEENDGVPDFGPSKYVYEPYVLLRSYLALEGRAALMLPEETEALIEAVYGKEPADHEELPSGMSRALAGARAEMADHQIKEQNEAQNRLVPGPDNWRLLNACKALLQEDKPELHRALQALTRLIPPSVSLVCLHETAAGLTLEPEGGGPVVDLDKAPGSGLARELAQRTVSVSHRGVLGNLLAQPPPAGWRDHPVLRSHRAAVYRDGICVLSDVSYELRLDRKLGLEIVKEVR